MRFQLGNDLKLFERAFVIPEVYVDGAQRALIGPVVRIDFDSLLQGLDGFIFLSGRRVGATEAAISLIGIRRNLQRAF